MALSSDLTFITNEPGNSLRDRFGTLLASDTRYFDCLVGYFYISGFYRIFPSLENVEKIRILIGLQTNRITYELLQHAKTQGELALTSHASAREQVTDDVLHEYGGAFLSNVVGLGKTYMAALLAQQLNGRSLVIARAPLRIKE